MPSDWSGLEPSTSAAGGRTPAESRGRRPKTLHINIAHTSGPQYNALCSRGLHIVCYPAANHHHHTITPPTTTTTTPTTTGGAATKTVLFRRVNNLVNTSLLDWAEVGNDINCRRPSHKADDITNDFLMSVFSPPARSVGRRPVVPSRRNAAYTAYSNPVIVGYNAFFYSVGDRMWPLAGCPGSLRRGYRDSTAYFFL